MNVEQVFSDIQKLPAMAGAIRLKEPKALDYLRALYLQVTGETVVAGCKGCHLKAAHYLSSLTIEKLKQMANKQFKLKDNVLLEFPYRSGSHHTAKSITDETAKEYLTHHPEGIKHFDEYPKDSEGNLQLEVKEKKKAKE